MRIFQKKPLPPEPAAPHPVTAAVIVAAGQSTRMGTPKPFILLDGVPVIGHTLRAFQQAQTIDEIVLVARQEDILNLYDISRAYGITKLSNIVLGGENRQQSVQNGIHAVHDGTAYFAIHDGARPLIHPHRIDVISAAAYQFGAAAAAVPVKDTIKTTDEQGFVVKTPDRSRLWHVQTPQTFERALYLNALHAAAAAGQVFTDDCQLVEQLGVPIKLIEGEYDNIKMTTPEDVSFAEMMLKGRS